MRGIDGRGEGVRRSYPIESTVARQEAQTTGILPSAFGFLPIDDSYTIHPPSPAHLLNHRALNLPEFNHNPPRRAFGTARRVSEHYSDLRRVRQLFFGPLLARGGALFGPNRPPEGSFSLHIANPILRQG